MTIRIYATGGTFDKEYDQIKGALVFQETHVAEMLRKGRCRVPIDVRTLMMVDSLDMDDDDRQLILNHCQKCAHQQIVITHGTDTLEETARVLGPAIRDKTVVLVGAMIPYTFGSSDGLFNLGAAIAFAQTLPPGVYVAMNGRIFDWDNVRKNRDIGEFEALR
jgi:L-asparaginase